MKNKFSLMIAAALVASAIIFASFKSVENQAAATSETVIVRATQFTFGGRNNSFLKVYYGNNLIDKSELNNRWGYTEEEANLNTIATTLNRLNQEGYVLVSATETGMSQGVINTYVLTKK